MNILKLKSTYLNGVVLTSICSEGVLDVAALTTTNQELLSFVGNELYIKVNVKLYIQSYLGCNKR